MSLEHLAAHGYELDDRGIPVRKVKPVVEAPAAPVDDQVAELRAQVAALTAQMAAFEKTPANDAKRVHAERIARIQRDMSTVKALVAGTPEDRVAMLANLKGTPLTRLVEMMELPTLITIARGMPRKSIDEIKLALGSNGAGMIPTLDAELVETSKLPKATVVTFTRPGGSFAIPSPSGQGIVLETGTSATLPTAFWEKLLENTSLIATAIATHDLEAHPANEDQTRRYVAKQLASGALMFDGRTLYDPAIAAAHEETPLSARSALKRIRQADAQAEIAANQDTGSIKTSATKRAEAEKNNALGEAIADAIEKRRAKRAPAK